MALCKVADAATPFCHHNAESQFYGFFKTKEGRTANWEGFFTVSNKYVNSFFWDCVGFYIPIICSNRYFAIPICIPKVPFEDPF